MICGFVYCIRPPFSRLSFAFSVVNWSYNLAQVKSSPIKGACQEFLFNKEEGCASVPREAGSVTIVVGSFLFRF
tara:strand:+ start:658 stop:879 length:222 start_codon:yes stop_codon:yes gene_type:complete